MTLHDQVQPGQTTTITLGNIRQSPEQLLLRETRQQVQSPVYLALNLGVFKVVYDGK